MRRATLCALLSIASLVNGGCVSLLATCSSLDHQATLTILDGAKLEALEKAGRCKRVPFEDRAAMAKLVEPVMEAYAKEIGASEIAAKIKAA